MWPSATPGLSEFESLINLSKNEQIRGELLGLLDAVAHGCRSQRRPDREWHGYSNARFASWYDLILMDRSQSTADAWPEVLECGTVGNCQHPPTPPDFYP